MILLGGLIALWGALVLGFSKTLHVRWRGMIVEMRRHGVKNDIPMTNFFASPEGLLRMRIAGAVALLAGVGMIVAGLVRGDGVGF